MIEGLVAANGYVAGFIDTAGTDDGSGSAPTYADSMGDVDPALGLFEDLHTLGPPLRQLDERERAIVEMRFGQETTQAGIGRDLHRSEQNTVSAADVHGSGSPTSWECGQAAKEASSSLYCLAAVARSSSERPKAVPYSLTIGWMSNWHSRRVACQLLRRVSMVVRFAPSGV